MLWRELSVIGLDRILAILEQRAKVTYRNGKASVLNAVPVSCSLAHLLTPPWIGETLVLGSRMQGSLRPSRSMIYSDCRP